MAKLIGKPAPPRATTVLTAILDALSIESAEVTSVARDAKDQARIMLGNCIDKGVAEQMRTYKAPGRAVVKVLTDMRPAIQAAMEAKIREVGLANVTHHALQDDSPVEVLDIGQSSIPEAKHEAFVVACKSSVHLSKILVENGCFHVEIFKAVPAVQST